ncbi:MAG: sulfite exporter TauE/SafE family protein [Acutalibacteraceae bacterium]
MKNSVLLAGKKSLFTYQTESGKKRRTKAALLVMFGLLTGAVNGLFGAGGGMLAVPVLTYVAGLDERKSHATAIAVILPLCIISTIVYALQGGFDYSIFPPTVAGVVAGGVLGAVFLKKASGTFLNVLFYGLMLFAGLKMML